MAIPELLASTLADLPEDDRFELLEGWVDRGGGAWSFRFRARLSVPASEFMPEWSEWHLVVTAGCAKPDIHVYPDAARGITAQFPHQAFNAEPKDAAAWRAGSPCLGRPVSAFRREGWSGEPAEFGFRVQWNIGRLFSWIDAAAVDRLIADGDPIELPMPPSVVGGALGFRETVEDLVWWNGNAHRWGFATLAAVPGSTDNTVVVDFMDPQRSSIRQVPWGPGVPTAPGRVDAVWIVLPALVVGLPWRFPRTWEELTGYCSMAAVDLPTIMADAGAKLRHVERPKKPVPRTLLVGFPMSQIHGAPAERMHWLAFDGMRTARRADVRKGFSNRAGARREWDRTMAAEKRPLAYERTANWAPDQLRRRGEAEAAVRGSSMLILGGGALGGAVAENLVRMGVSRIGIVDADRVGMGNLSRHVLSMRDAGWNKATALAKRLNGAMPDANVSDFGFAFPPSEDVDRKKLDGWDVVVDCTAEDEVLRAMAEFPWDGMKVFVSLSMTWQARGLVAYADEQASFPAIDAIERFVTCSERPDEERLGLMEGIGCWHPVFPASADDVQLWAAVGTKFVRRAVTERRRICEHFIQDAYGAVVRHEG